LTCAVAPELPAPFRFFRGEGFFSLFAVTVLRETGVDFREDDGPDSVANAASGDELTETASDTSHLHWEHDSRNTGREMAEVY
jgi:hypothetical protein